jgi:hypothetical protein
MSGPGMRCTSVSDLPRNTRVSAWPPCTSSVPLMTSVGAFLPIGWLGRNTGGSLEPSHASHPRVPAAHTVMTIFPRA